jgi:hypothetical protein
MIGARAAARKRWNELRTLVANPLTAKTAGVISIVRISVAVRSFEAGSQAGTTSSVSGRENSARISDVGMVTTIARVITRLVSRQAPASSSFAKYSLKTGMNAEPTAPPAST